MEIRITVYYKLSSLPRQTGLVVFWGPGSAINPSGHWHLYDPTVLLHVSSERQVSGCWHSSISKMIKPRHQSLFEILEKSNKSMYKALLSRNWWKFPNFFDVVEWFHSVYTISMMWADNWGLTLISKRTKDWGLPWVEFLTKTNWIICILRPRVCSKS